VIGFKLNKQTNDIEAVGGKITLLSTVQQAVRQRLSIKFKTFQGEYFLDTTYGLPYRQQIIGKGRTKAEIDALYILEINRDPEVRRVNYFNSVYDPIKRDYKLDFEVVVDDRLLRSNDAQLSASDEIDYGDGSNEALVPSCNLNFLQYSLDLHPILHEDLPEGGRSSWIYP
jgi:hypothetical protein